MDNQVTVRAYLNNASDARGIPLGMLFGYEPGHEVALAFEATLPASDDLRICELIFDLLNIGHDPDFSTTDFRTPDARALAYRADGHRSLAVGDLVTIDNRAYAYARRGFTPAPMPSPAADAPALPLRN